MAEKSSWDQANRRQKLGLVWRNRKKISQIIKDLLLLTVLPLNYFMTSCKMKMLYTVQASTVESAL
jgi:hypothetical protein